MFRLKCRDKESKARAGVLVTAHGDIPTPVFMPVGTAGTVKGVLQRDLAEDIDAKIILGNTYHLFLRPGTEILKAAGGLHKFMRWERPILTDSGGYQVFSMNEIRKITEEGAMFRSHIDGSKHLFTPENTIDIQRTIGADIMMAFDECTPYPCEYKYAEKSLRLTHRWLDRAINRYKETEPLWGNDQMLFPIVQGSTFADLRRESSEYAAASGMAGIAIGGLSVGEPADEMYRIIEVVNEIL
ncbi:MAG: tRNA guanosine(34) transglycosylase Tgt, partial [Odoribacter sp.]|nr:tRNA guanosine(34) transglycosylase Tgt [Odoribacter sp.]